MEWETAGLQMVRAVHTGMACCSWVSLPVRGPQACHGAHGDAIMPPFFALDACAFVRDDSLPRDPMSSAPHE
jgi:hypothetical protein